MTDRRWLWALIIALHPALAAAQASHVSLVINEAGVTLDARNATLVQILEEWSRVGGTKILNLEAVDHRPMTLSFAGVPERQALDILLRDIGGYILGARGAGDHTVSQFAGLVVVPTQLALPERGGGAAGFAESSSSAANVAGPSTSDDAPERPEPQPIWQERLRPRVFQRPMDDPSPGAAVGAAPPEQAAPPSRSAGPNSPFGGATGAATPGVIVPVEKPQAPPETNLETARTSAPPTSQP